ncbi:MBL fold metallo-hydrolase [Solirubrum puertoriconensis]|uniref:Twin-arginine translocation pathway signal n=1 Tax=Solirubrum puertoriconensis TaxID=1751427 RepID=A0A9X0HNU2_SOLP1|nr:MBL fold metallo-hydrolase [Solirubrum puertoriconensis]KUG09358.1 twin-arginine translocation pathway signal [Solirubrum puertoriconensis]
MARSRRIWLPLLAAVLVLAAGAVLVGCSLSAPRYKGPRSEHFNGKEFVNQPPVEEKGFGGVLKWMFNRDKDEWPEQPNAFVGPPPARQVAAGKVRLTFVGHGTFLLQVDGLNILTDPIWSERCSPFSWIGPKRMRPPGLRFEELPRIDAVVISHNHYDHLDLPTLQRLAERDKPLILVPLGVKKLLDEEGIANATELDWWQQRDLGQAMQAVCVPAQHFSGRGLSDRNATLWAGWVLRTKAGKLYYAGDTGYGPFLQEIARREGPIQLAILPIGAYKPQWFMEPIHMSPAQAVQAHRDLGAVRSVATHFGTFQMADDGLTEPVTDLRQAMQQQQVPDSAFVVLREGVGWRKP